MGAAWRIILDQVKLPPQFLTIKARPVDIAGVSKVLRNIPEQRKGRISEVVLITCTHPNVASVVHSEHGSHEEGNELVL